ncbi:hypothetical protein BGX26_002067 [Mortierella sp. AD094]|nr:hypothetical protein BGX26_002067 [Mortierella sp. AD094]
MTVNKANDPPITGLFSTSSLKRFLPVVKIEAHTIILETISRTKLTQTYLNPSNSPDTPELRYTFPLYDGVSIVGFTCRIGDRTIVGHVKERDKAHRVYKDSVARGEKAALLEQLPNASDIFTTTVGNVPAGSTVIIEIIYVGELKHDAEVNGIRFTIPTHVVPRYSAHPVELVNSDVTEGNIQITVDVAMAETNFIKQILSPSHPIAVSLGATSLAPEADPVMSRASATLSLDAVGLDKDFIVNVVAKDAGLPTAVLEIHPTIPNQRALMATLVPRFLLPPENPEIVFICDRSGSMTGPPIRLVQSALRVFLKSIPVGAKFNICSFGTKHSFLWETSQIYSQSTLEEAIKHVDTFTANMGGTEMLEPFKAVFDQRRNDTPLEVMLLTDGAIVDQKSLFTYINTQIHEKKAFARVFTLGIGNGVSHALIEGVAKAGNGFSQSAGHGEKIESKIIRMLRAALSPHVVDYTLEVKYSDEDSTTTYNEIVEKVADSLRVDLNIADKKKSEPSSPQELRKISLFDTLADLDKDMPVSDVKSGASKYWNLPFLAPPKLLQAPDIIPPLYTFNRTSVYLLMGHGSSQLKPKSVVLRGTSMHGLLELEIPVHILDTPGETIHQLAARKATMELEQGRGWITQAKDSKGNLIKHTHHSTFSDMVEREAVRLGVQFQVQGKWTSFVAVENQRDNEGLREELKEVELLSVASVATKPPEIPVRPPRTFGNSSHYSMSFTLPPPPTRHAPNEQIAASISPPTNLVDYEGFSKYYVNSPQSSPQKYNALPRQNEQSALSIRSRPPRNRQTSQSPASQYLQQQPQPSTHQLPPRAHPSSPISFQLPPSAPQLPDQLQSSAGSPSVHHFSRQAPRMTDPPMGLPESALLEDEFFSFSPAVAPFLPLASPALAPSNTEPPEDLFPPLASPASPPPTPSGAKLPEHLFSTFASPVLTPSDAKLPKEMRFTVSPGVASSGAGAGKRQREYENQQGQQYLQSQPQQQQQHRKQQPLLLHQQQQQYYQQQQYQQQQQSQQQQQQPIYMARSSASNDPSAPTQIPFTTPGVFSARKPLDPYTTAHLRALRAPAVLQPVVVVQEPQEPQERQKRKLPDMELDVRLNGKQDEEPVQQPKQTIPRMDHPNSRDYGSPSGSIDGVAVKSSSNAGEGVQDSKPLVATGSKLEILVELQTFNGSWEWQQKLLSCIDVVLEQAEKLGKDNGWNQDIVATALAIAYFEKKLAKERDTWELVASKAKGWLKEQIGQDQADAAVEKAAELIV